MKKSLIALAVIGLALPALAQTSTNTTTISKFLQDAYDTMIGQGLTNLTETTYCTYTPSAHKWGVGEVVTRDIPIGGGVGTGIGIGVDYYSSQLYAINGQVSLDVDITPLSGWTNVLGAWAASVVVTPYTFIGLGTPFSGSGTDNGGIETIAATGTALHLGTIPYIKADASLGGVYGTRSGIGEYSGTFYGGTASLTWKF